jgi:hypothetical protein
MVRLDLCQCTIALVAAVLMVAVSSAYADMRVLDSNVAKYPRDSLIKGHTINDLGPKEWVRVLMLNDNKTRFFGDPPRRREEFGTRR